MGRILGEIVFPAVLPALLYALWLIAQRRRAQAAGAGVPAWAEAPWLWLGALGVLLAGALLLAGVLFSSGARNGVYVPPRADDAGNITPAHVDPK